MSGSGVWLFSNIISLFARKATKHNTISSYIPCTFSVPTHTMASSLSGINAVASSFTQCKQPKTGMSRFIVRSSSLGTSVDPKENQVSHPDTDKFHVSRRVSLGIGAIAFFSQLKLGPARAEDPPTFNGWWLTEPIPAPVITSKIMNAETGTRSFLQKGIYLGTDIGPEVNAYKLKQCAFDLLSMKDLIYQGDVWPHIRRYLCFKSTIMYYNFDKLITGVADNEKPVLTDLANRFFDNAEVLLDAVQKQDESLTKSVYADTEVLLQEVMAKTQVQRKDLFSTLRLGVSNDAPDKPQEEPEGEGPSFDGLEAELKYSKTKWKRS